ncbi:MAG: epoxyqueuosine reductase [Candidatus Abyssobacteria bacterium SURF_5]|uniref:Epoxyqueuosine reductase n=1 Tax=Abyssobacteria bacterium (strain SURF_5) TaxID=2093360 RepID=A0A3A4NP76_ABYX5|nr:MAG: epoxyqueuosine reductase [Candidatus Abyssubacteria bacterium SURF_5]
MKNQDIIKLINDFVARGEGNHIPECGGMRMYDPSPLVGFASANDPLYAELKKEGVIGPHHTMPQDWVPNAKSVIAFFLPFTKEVIESNYPEGMSSKEWYLTRYYGEDFLNALRDHVAASLQKAGYQAVAPSRSDNFEMLNTSSNWSERHSAYIAGMGTFCLSYALINEKGCAGRYGTVVTDLELQPSPRTKGLRDNCLYDEKGTCGLCIARCPVGAITPEGKDHMKCQEFLVTKVMAHYVPQYNIVVGGCGKCQTKVPCARKIPKKADL